MVRAAKLSAVETPYFLNFRAVELSRGLVFLRERNSGCVEASLQCFEIVLHSAVLWPQE